MAVHILFFGSAAAAAGRREAQRPLAGPIPLREALGWREFAAVGASRPGLRFAVNGEFAGLDAWVKDGDELAVIPPVSGG